jgi:hypothetical protein
MRRGPWVLRPSKFAVPGGAIGSGEERGTDVAQDYE